MKRIVMTAVVLITLLVPMSVMGNGQQAKGDGELLIGAAMADFSDKWLSYLHDGVIKFDEEHSDVTISMTDGKGDPAVQLNSIETLLAKGADAIITVPVDISAMGPVIRACKEAGVPLICINRAPEEDFMKEIDCYVGSDSIVSGVLQGEWVAETMQPDGGQIGILMGQLGHEAAALRTRGNKDIFDGYDNLSVVIEASGQWDRAKGMRIAENWLQKGGIDAIVANNDEMAIGAILAAEAMGLKDEEILIAGIDATPDALEYLGKGLDVTVFQSAMGQGYGGAEAAYRILKGEKLEKMQWIPYELVTVDQKDEYLARWQ